MNILIIGNEEQLKGYCQKVGIEPNVNFEYPFAVDLDTNTFGSLMLFAIRARTICIYDQWVRNISKSNVEPKKVQRADKQTVIFVDGACSGNPGKGQCRGVLNGDQIFFRSTQYTTNNIMEFWAIALAIDWVKEQNNKPNADLGKVIIYSDSKTAQSWVRKEAYKSSMKDDLNSRILYWSLMTIKENKHLFELRNWDTKTLGEIPADFGNKK